MLRFLLISALIIYTIIALYNYFSGPFKEGLKGQSTTRKTSSEGKLVVTHNPLKGKAKKGTVGDYTDFEELKDKDSDA
jgi:hypothetical protein